MKIDCNDCEHIYPNEEQQEDSKVSHICCLSMKAVLHNGRHPCLPTPKWCPINNQETINGK